MAGQAAGPDVQPPPRGPEVQPPPRRMSRESRRRHLVTAATALVARQGLGQLSLEELAARAGVTRNLLYHYFPRGRADVVAAVVRAAEQQLLDDWQAERRHGLEPAVSRILDHALAPTHAWRIHRLARASQDPELAAITDEFLGRARAGRPQSDHTPLAQTALRGYLAFAESALDEARRAGLPRRQLLGLLRDTFRALPLEDPAGASR